MMQNEFTAIIQQDEGWFVAYSPEVPGATGQGRGHGEPHRRDRADP